MSEFTRQRLSTSVRDRRAPADDVEPAREASAAVGKLTAEDAKEAEPDRAPIAPGKVTGDADVAEVAAAVALADAADRKADANDRDAENAHDEGALASALGFVTPAAGAKAER